MSLDGRATLVERSGMAINRPGMVVAAVVAFLVGALWYSPLLFGARWMELRGVSPESLAEMKVPAALLLGEGVRCLVLAYVLARLAVLAGVVDWRGAVKLSVCVWIGFPVTLLMGSVLWEQVRWQLAALHAGDWFVKTVLMALVLGAWPRRVPDARNAAGNLRLSRPVIASTGMLIRRPVAEVFEAFVDPDATTKFWFTRSNGRLEAGKQVRWDWEMYGISIPVTVKVLEPNRRILIEWPGYGSPTTVEWTFTAWHDDSTFVAITNTGFTGDGDSLVKQATDSAQGFTLVLAGLKALLERGIQLGLVADRFPKGIEEH